jgi:hypothetical protein
MRLRDKMDRRDHAAQRRAAPRQASRHRPLQQMKGAAGHLVHSEEPQHDPGRAPAAGATRRRLRSQSGRWIGCRQSAVPDNVCRSLRDGGFAATILERPRSADRGDASAPAPPVVRAERLSVRQEVGSQAGRVHAFDIVGIAWHRADGGAFGLKMEAGFVRRGVDGVNQRSRQPQEGLFGAYIDDIFVALH